MNRINQKTSSNNTSGSNLVVNPLPDFGMEGRDYFLPFHLIMTTPKNTSQSSYLSTSITLPVGRINALWVEFPSGCVGLAGFQLWRGARQIFPLKEGVWQVGDNIFIRLPFTHIMFTEPLQIVGRSYNLDDTFQHRMTVILEMSGNQSDLPEGFQSFLDTLR
jgi:hypothetical protein